MRPTHRIGFTRSHEGGTASCRPLLGAVALALALALPSAAWGAGSDDQQYLILEGQEAGRRIVVAVMEPDAVERVRELRPVLFVVRWMYTETDTGMPTGPDLELMRTINQELDAAFDDTQPGMTRTGNGERVWYYYVSLIDPYQERARKVFASHGLAAFDVALQPDENWMAVRSVLDAIEGGQPPKGAR